MCKEEQRAREIRLDGLFCSAQLVAAAGLYLLKSYTICDVEQLEELLPLVSYFQSFRATACCRTAATWITNKEIVNFITNRT